MYASLRGATMAFVLPAEPAPIEHFCRKRPMISPCLMAPGALAAVPLPAPVL